MLPARLNSILAATLGAGLAVTPVAASVSGPDIFGTERLIAKTAPEYRPFVGVGCELPASQLTLDRAIDLGLCRNPMTRQAWAAAQAQAAEFGVAEGAYLPSIALSGSKNRVTGASSAYTLNGSPIDGQNAIAELNWTLLDFGARRSAVDNARNLVSAAAHLGSATAQQVVADVVQAYYGVVANDGAVAASQQTEANAARSLEIARALQSGGAASLADVMQAETAYQQAIYGRIQAANAAKSGRANLAVLLGFPAEQSLSLAPVLAPEAPAVMRRVTDLLTLAAQQRPDLAAARDQRSAAEAAVTSARAAGRPKISLIAQRDISDYSTQPRQTLNGIGLTVTVPIFTGFQTHYGIRRAEAARDQVDAQVEQARLRVTLDVWSAYHGLEAANQELATSAALAKAAATNEEIAIGRYQAGVGSMLDVLTAQSAGANARLTRIQTEYNWQSARAQLALAVGRLASTTDIDTVAPIGAP